VTPATLRALPPAAAGDGDRALTTWNDAVRIANEFLASPFNLSLPAGKIELDETEGMSFTTAAGSWPVRVHCSTFGDLVGWAGGQAASLRSGFVVGKTRCEDSMREPERAVDNSLFAFKDGRQRAVWEVAKTILHETAHLVHGRGFWKNCGYLIELLCLWRTAYNSIEDRPRASTAELLRFAISRSYWVPVPDWHHPEAAYIELAIELLKHRPHEDHGPYLEPPPAPPASREGSVGVRDANFLAGMAEPRFELERFDRHRAFAQTWLDKVSPGLDDPLRTEVLRLWEIYEARARVLRAALEGGAAVPADAVAAGKREVAALLEEVQKHRDLALQARELLRVPGLEAPP
jgi:hypothetical protein